MNKEHITERLKTIDSDMNKMQSLYRELEKKAAEATKSYQVLAGAKAECEFWLKGIEDADSSSEE